MENNIVKVSLWGQTVGEIYWDEKRRQSCFSFSSDFIIKGLDIAPLTASIHNPLLARGEVYLGNKKDLYKGLPEFLADSLPDNWGERVMNHWADHYGGKVRLTPVDALSLMGKRSMGAFEFEPYMEKWERATDIKLSELYELASIIMEESKFPEGEEPLIHLQKLFSVGTSAGGKRPKAIIAINQETGEIKSGQGLLPSEYKYYILKFNEGKQFPTTLLEKTYYDMAIEAGINMMPSSLKYTDGTPHFITERFDRLSGKKVHTQTLAAMAPEADSYEDLFSVARKLGVPSDELVRLYRQAVFNFLGDNLDDHNKNFSFVMHENGDWHISPAYDLCFTYDLTGMGFANRHELSICGKDKDITKDDLLMFGRTNDIRGAESIIKEVSDVLLNFREYALKNGVSEFFAEVIQKKLCQNIGIKPEADREQRGGDDSNQSGFFDHIVIRKNKEKYTINASLRGVRLREKRIQHEDFLAYSFGLVSKEELADKYFQEEIKHSKDESKSIM
jgi:serine/threonine-protein kinase HipA